jgi:pimeloyl-ACP methyl ester carboxylesterase
MTSRQAETFNLHVPDAALADLRERLSRMRFPDQSPGEPWAYGTDLNWMAGFVDYWRDGFDWRAQEARLNSFPQYKVSLQGIDLHFLHVPGNGPDPHPLLLSHGWPGSVFEFLDLIPRLTDPGRFGADPADAFTVVVPSLPGYGLSFTPGQARLGIEAIADCFAELMTEILGYRRFGAQGGDWGSRITAHLGLAYPERMSGLHLNMMPVGHNAEGFSARTPEESRYLDELRAWMKEESGYGWIQGTRPQTLAFALTDSPAGLAAWIVEKFRAWSDCAGDVETVFTRDRLLANIGLYWFTGAIGSSFWPYYSRRHSSGQSEETKIVTVPTGYCEFPHEIVRPPRSVAEQVFRDIRRWSVMPRGGHFAAMEQPEALAQEIRELFRPLRSE